MKTIGFIGAGQMAKSLAAGIAASQGKAVEFLIADPNDDACEAFTSMIGGQTSVKRAADNQSLVNGCELVILAVKPQYVDDALNEIQFDHNPLIVSIVAGFRLLTIQRLTGTNRVIRVMPNTPCLIGKGATAFSTGDEVDESDVELIRTYLSSVGLVVEVDESLMDSVTGLSGSGPAFVYTFVEALIDGAVLTGLARTTARDLAIQTVIGAAEMMLQTGEHPGVLRDRVTSPGGTTIEGVKALEENSFRDAVMSAVFAATERAKDLGG